MIRLALAVTLGALGACQSATAPGESDLALARQRWAQSNVRSYDYTISRSCFCTPESMRPVTVSVTNGIVTRQVYADTGGPVATAIPDFTTVDALFDVIDAAFARHADRVDASYDPIRGVPLSIWIDASFQMADEEFGYSVSAFRAR
jgi:Family of unknown function (DUF6174)